MKHLCLLLALTLMGCAHSMTVPSSVEDAQSQADSEVNARKDETSQVVNDQTADIQNQANGKMNSGKSQAMSQLAVSNATTSKAIAAEVFRRMPLITETRALTYANAVGQYMAQELVPSLKCHSDGTQASGVRVAIVKSTTPSSFSLPGGIVFVTTSLMQKMTSEDELAGVLANEIVLSVCQKGVPTNIAAEAASGWSDYVMSLPTKSLSRTDLGFADKYALVTLYRRGYDVAPYVSFVAKTENSGRHMYGAERAAILKKSVDATPAINSTSSARLSRFNAAKSKSI